MARKTITEGSEIRTAFFATLYSECCVPCAVLMRFRCCGLVGVGAHGGGVVAEA